MIKLYFGKVVDVKDDEKLNRIKVSIPGYTDKIETSDLPFYYPFYGQNYIPIVDDVVPIIIVNDNFTQGFYNHKIDLVDNGLSGTEYENYVEIYKRLGVEMYYKESEGWIIRNKDKSNIQVLGEVINIISDKINHNQGSEPMVLGDTLLDLLEQLIDAILALTVQTAMGPSSVPINSAKFSSIKSNLVKFKSKKSFLD